ncbi:hypothetical protein XELAEV_18018510mg [Xenopus laevis]|uniref:Uncharacterized protein n=1 Tax=Xenopus laevis TaxID=8355 RepID=A0A974HU15_XENLA|nr:hypothetical protein XELAEV_18018510mg [Xenopus laevis]
MAFLFNDSEWESDINEVFDNVSESEAYSDTEIRSLVAEFKVYKKTLIQQMRLRWEISSLENYVKAKMVPRGLRLKKSPSFNLKKSGGQEFLDKWNSILSDCSPKLMQLMIVENTKNITQINKQVEEERSKLEENKEDNQFSALNDKIKSELMKIQQEIKIRKKKKFLRDTEDYKKGQVYVTHENQFNPSDNEQEYSEGRQGRKLQSKNGERDQQEERKEREGHIQLRDRSKWGYSPKRRFKKKM